ncbi:Acyl-coenzyme A thioesterase PaaI, contains HGG motif [Tistlia consotensis]|uniref:Acyl-coenzyme A thioesterase PaaI, contains HGG motif n=1 Tax=Tistlia consotensis USBA 355 TaxID=560819 RepID=A0A1Y6CBW2_9PROT|nr:PaaI family thioesterase [Tistlia consotensis]SMF54022.1 Acyl-coenzyme A thioesterase PaaI, contains HGG motif [Tistlia consotensis USBA 355]SNR86416.1 Acyl-coenzyme A thioesterase PaaI, contains HGG motif [Tistlia consotensis]
MAVRIDEADLKRIREQLPWLDMLGIEIAEMAENRAVLTLADAAMYFAILATIGPVEMALTTSLSINFLRPPPPGALRADCRILKLGKRLAYGEVFLYASAADPEHPVAHTTLTYSIPPDRPSSPVSPGS